jgi:putative nucleotidyltransferase with HDIG domain
MMNKVLKVHSRLLITLVLSIILPIFVLSYFAYMNLYDARLEHHLKEVRDILHQEMNTTVDIMFDKVFDVSLYNDLVYSFDSKDEIEAFIQATVLENEDMLGMAYYNMRTGEYINTGSRYILFSEIKSAAIVDNQLVLGENDVSVVASKDSEILVATYNHDLFFGNSYDYGIDLATYYDSKLIEIVGEQTYPETFQDIEMLDQQYAVVSSDDLKIQVITKIDSSTIYNTYAYQKRHISIQIGIIILLGLSAILIFTINKKKDLQEIVDTVNLLLKGNYAARLKEKGAKEQIEIRSIFNEMANKIENKIDQHVKGLDFMIFQNNQIKETTDTLTKSISTLNVHNEELHVWGIKNSILMDQFEYLIIRYHIDGRIEYMNKYACSQLGVSDFSGLNVKHLLFNRDSSVTKDEIISFFVNNDAEKLRLGLINLDTNVFKYYYISSRGIKNRDGKRTVQIIGKDISIEDVLKDNLDRRRLEYDILESINFENLEYASIENYYKKVIKSIHNLVEPLEVSLSRVEGNVLKPLESISDISEYRNQEPFKIRESVFESVIETKSNKVIIDSHRALLHFNAYYRMSNISDVFRCVYLYPIIISETVSNIMMIITEKPLGHKDSEMMQSIINHLNFGIERVELINSLKRSSVLMIRALSRSIEAKDRYTVGHSERVAEISALLARDFGCEKTLIEEIYLAGLLHDIGKLGVADKILVKEGRLTPEEYDKIKEHSKLGYNILREADFSNNILEGALLHHKRFDLTGYPEWEVEVLGIVPSIIGVADALDAILSFRTYSPGKSINFAIEELKRFRGTQFNPMVADLAVEEMKNNPRFFMKIFESGGRDELSGIVSEV